MLTRIYANNYRCFVNFEMRPQHSGLLLGYNGVGKTSVFDVLGALQDLLVWNQNAEDAFPTDTLTEFGGSVEQRFEIEIDSEWGPMCYALVVTHDTSKATCKIASEALTLSGQPLYRFNDTEGQIYRDDHTILRDAFSYSPKRSFLASIEARPYNRRLMWFKEFLGNVWILKLNPQAADASSRMDHGFLARNGSNFSSWCRNIFTDVPDRMEEATNALKRVMPGFQRLRMQTAGRTKLLLATFNVPGGKPYDLDFEMLSDGQRSLIILYVVLYTIRNYTAMLCLDEPDNFVSIREIQPFLIELADATDDHKFQSILISHSSEVIDFIGWSGVTLLERPDGGVTRVGKLAKQGSLKLSELMARGWHSEDEGGDAIE